MDGYGTHAQLIFSHSIVHRENYQTERKYYTKRTHRRPELREVNKKADIVHDPILRLLLGNKGKTWLEQRDRCQNLQ